MSLTVTATLPTTTNWFGGIAFQVLVITGATASGGATSISVGGTPSFSFTPSHNGSLLTWAVSNLNPGTAITGAASGNTLQSFDTDPADGISFGFGYYAGTVTGGTPATVGATSTGTAFAQFAYEMPASGTPAVDASTPALASATGTGTGAVTTASFTPPSNAVLVAIALANNYSSGTGAAPVITDSGGRAWTTRLSQAGNSGQLLPAIFATALVTPPVPHPGLMMAFP